MIRLLGAALLALGFTSGAIAQTHQPKIFVASTGDDGNDGGRATPKRSFRAAHDAVAAGGEIVALDTAGYGPLTITKSVGIVVPTGVTAFVTVTAPNTNGITINAGSTDIVTLKGLIVEGIGGDNSNDQGIGIAANSTGTVIIEDTIVRNFSSGIKISDSSRTAIRRGAVRNTSVGIRVVSTSTAPVSASVSDMELIGNQYGLYADGQTVYPSLTVVATRCLFQGSGTSAIITALIAVVPSAKADVIIDNSTITGNAAAFGEWGSTIYTRGNNTVYANTQLGATPTPLSPQ